MILLAVDALSSFDRRIADAFVMRICASCAASTVLARFIYMFITLTVETLLQSAVSVEIFACSMRVLVE